MGVYPLKVHPNLVSEFEVDRKVDNIYDKTNDSFLIHPIQRKTEVVSYYLNALREKEPLYQFLDFYHILETYFYIFFVDYLKDFLKSREPSEFFKNIDKLKKDEYIIAKSIEFICSNNDFYNLKCNMNLLENKINQFITEMNENIFGDKINSFSNWEKDKQNSYYYFLGRLIYKARCEIAHRKIQKILLPNTVKVVLR